MESVGRGRKSSKVFIIIFVLASTWRNLWLLDRDYILFLYLTVHSISHVCVDFNIYF